MIQREESFFTYIQYIVYKIIDKYYIYDYNNREDIFFCSYNRIKTLVPARAGRKNLDRNLSKNSISTERH